MNAGSVGMVGLMAANSVLPSEEGGSKKIRKPYTITKSRESWTEQEHDKFLEALQLFDRDWKKIEAFVGSKTVIQIRSHAQKYFLKVQKNGTGEHVPPPRPKRKSAQPYPQKAVKSAAPAQPNARGLTVPHGTPDYRYMIGPPQQCNMYVPAVSASPVTPWVHHTVPPSGSIPFNYKDVHQPELATPSGMKNSSTGSSACTWSQPHVPTTQGGPERGKCRSTQMHSKQMPSGDDWDDAHFKATASSLPATPAFSEVYKFIGSIFDPEVTGHLKRLRELAPIDRETVLLLMRNLAINLSSPDFDERKLFSSVYGSSAAVEEKPSLAASRTDCDDIQVTTTTSAAAGDPEAVRQKVPAPVSQQQQQQRHQHHQQQQQQQQQKISQEQAGFFTQQVLTDVSKHQRHPYDGGGGGGGGQEMIQQQQQQQELDEKDDLDSLYISEVLQEHSQMGLAFESSNNSTIHDRIVSKNQNNTTSSSSKVDEDDEDEQSVDRWWP